MSYAVASNLTPTDKNKNWLWPTIFLSICISAAPVAIGIFFYFPFDDAFISFRITENLVENGNALYNSGTKLYTSTSLIYPFWNAIWYQLLGKSWIYDVAIINGILQSIAVSRALYPILREANSYKASFFVLLAVCPLCLNLTHLVYGNTGLETGLYQCFLAFTLCSSNTGKLGWISGFVRPEGFLVGLAGLIGSVIKRESTRKVIAEGLYGILIISIWLILGYILFDAAIPQSIVAKSNYAIDRFAELKSGYLHNFFQGYGFFSFLIASAWFYFPHLQKTFIVPLIWLLINCLFFSIGASWWPWYVPPIFIPLIFLSGKSALAWFNYFNSKKALPSFYIPATIIFFIAFATLELTKTLKEAKKMSDAVSLRIKSGKKIGNWLTNNIPKSKTIMLEQLGILGYYSKDVKILDYPGLSSKEMSDYVSSLPWEIPISFEETETDSAVIGHFQTDYLLLFPKEVKAFNRLQKVRKKYVKLDSLPYYPDSEWFKQVVIFKKNPN